MSGPPPKADLSTSSRYAAFPSTWARASFVTGLTIGYGDIVPRQALGRALAVGIGICGFFLTGLIAGIAVYALRTALVERENG